MYVGYTCPTEVRMSDNVMQATKNSVNEFLSSVAPRRQEESKVLIEMYKKITKMEPVLWGPSIIGFGTQHYKYDTGREGDMPLAAFSPRKAQITFYFMEGFDHYTEQLSRLGKHKISVSCLYVNKLPDIDLSVLEEIMKASFARQVNPPQKIDSVEKYVASVPEKAKERFDELRAHVRSLLPEAKEVVSYGILGYKTDKKRAKVYISAFKDHLGVYPVPKEEALKEELTPYIRGKGTLHFSLSEPLPKELITRVVEALVSA